MLPFATLKQFLTFKKEFSECMIVSEQEGAEIWLGGKNTGLQTPRLLRLPKNQEILLELKHPGYESRQVWLRSSQLKSFYYCDLKRIPLRLVLDDDSENKNQHAYPQNQKTDLTALTTP